MQAVGLASADIVRVFPAEGIFVNVDSSVKEQFGEQIEAVIRSTLDVLDVCDCKVEIEDKGALDCTIAARVETAIRRASEK
ncbi:MAG: citrate lyase acyl carrier protein [Treponema sp.]|nr:MAG: citrate lyase acyl carrier protein [Treponema sp.]